MILTLDVVLTWIVVAHRAQTKGRNKREASTRLALLREAFAIPQGMRTSARLQLKEFGARSHALGGKLGREAEGHTQGAHTNTVTAETV